MILEFRSKGCIVRRLLILLLDVCTDSELMKTGQVEEGLSPSLKINRLMSNNLYILKF